jgi:type IV pilus assembly protein PilA
MKATRLRQGFSLVELMIVLAVIMILAAIAIPHFHEQLALTHETAAVEQIKTLQTMQAQYDAQFGRYAPTLADLGPPPGAGLIPKSLADGRKTGYIFSVYGTTDSYSVRAIPETFGSSGRRTFYSDESHVIRQNWSAQPADLNSPEI